MYIQGFNDAESRDLSIRIDGMITRLQNVRRNVGGGARVGGEAAHAGGAVEFQMAPEVAPMAVPEREARAPERPLTPDEGRNRRMQDHVGVRRRAERIIRRARRSVNRLQGLIAEAEAVAEDAFVGIMEVIEESDRARVEETEARHARMLIEDDIRRRWEGVEELADWADLAEEGEGYDEYINRISRALAERDGNIPGEN
jgi:hypothetical protein